MQKYIKRFLKYAAFSSESFVIDVILKGVLYQIFSNLVKKIFCLIGSIKQLIIMLLNLG